MAIGQCAALYGELYSVSCDECGEVLQRRLRPGRPEVFETAERAQKRAARDGWKVDGFLCVCKRCIRSVG